MSESKMREKIKQGLQSGSLNPLTGATSSFYNLNIAEKALSKAIKANRSRIRAWAKNTSADRAGAYLEIRYTHSSPVGNVITVQSGKLVETNKIELVLLKKKHNNKPYYILTAFPIMG